MDSFWVLETHFSVSTGFKDPLRFALEDDLFELSRIDCGCLSLLNIGRVFSPDLVVEQTLAAIDEATLISAFSKYFEEPLDHWNEGTVITSRNLMRE